MNDLDERGLLAIDVGNSQVKLGWFSWEDACTSAAKQSELPIALPRLPQPEAVLAVSHADLSEEQLAELLGDWLDRLPTAESRCCLASVHAGAAQRVREFLWRRSSDKPDELTAAKLSLEVRVDVPEKVGIDRLLCALAANRLRERNRPAIVVSLGTACTVNLIAADGAFEGGAIFPGLAMSAVALNKGTAALPLVDPKAIDAPADAIGKSTPAAISSGLFWGTVGAIQELIKRMAEPLETLPHVFITGGDAPQLAGKLVGPGGPARHVPNMVLAGIRIAARERLKA